MTIIIDSMKNHRPAKAEQTDVLRPYTMAEIDAMLDEAEAAFDAGDYLTQDQVFRREPKRLPANTVMPKNRSKSPVTLFSNKDIQI